MTAIAGEGTGMERDYDFSSALHAADLERRADDRPLAPASAPSSASIRARWRRGACRWCSTRRDRRLAGRASRRRRSTAARSPARRASCAKSSASRSSPPASPSSTIRCGRAGLRSRPFDAEGVAGQRRALVENGVLTTWLLDCASARELGLETTGHAQRGVSSTPSPGATNLHLEPAAKTPARADRRHRRGLLRHRPDRHGRQCRHRRLQPRRRRLLDREWRNHLSGQRGHDRRPSARDVRQPGARERSCLPLWHQRADRARRGHDRCRRTDSDRSGRSSRTAWPRACARPARSRSRCSARRSSNWIKHGNSPVSATPISRSTACCASG